MKRSLLVAPILLVAFFQAAARSEPYEPPVDLDYWKSLDFEARWVHYHASKRPRDHWMQFFYEQREEALLEWLVVSKGWSAAGSRLVALESPRWIRAACWNIDNPDSHTLESAQRTLLGNAPLVLDWIEKNPKAVRASLKNFVPELEKQAKGARADSKSFLPALDPKDVLAHLDAPPKVVEFGDRPRAQPRRTYLHQVERAISAMRTGGFFASPWREKLLTLTKHDVPTVRQAAYLAFSAFPPRLLPRRALLAQSRTGQPRDQAWALLAYSYADHPQVFSELHRRAHDPEDPAWEAAVSRLGDLGVGFTRDWLGELAKTLPEQRRTFLEKQLDKIRAREAAAKPKQVAGAARRLLEQAAWAAIHEPALAKPLPAWVVALLGKLKGDADVRRQLGILRASYTAPRSLGDRELRRRVQTLVREYAGTALGGK